MADPILSFTAQRILDQIDSLAVAEFPLTPGFKVDLDGLYMTMTKIKAVLGNAEERRFTSHSIGVWLRQLLDVLYEAEDFLDDVAYEVLPKPNVNSRGGFTGKVRRFFSVSISIPYRLRISREVKEIRERLDEMNANRAAFDFVGRDDRWLDGQRETAASLASASVVIGREKDRETIVKFLLDPQGYRDDDNVSVMSIVGVGGIGKTVVTNMVCNDVRVTSHFDTKVWVFCSDTKGYNPLQFMEKIVKSITGRTRVDNLDLEHLAGAIRDHFRGKRFLLVLEDVWNEDTLTRGKLRELLASGAKGSKVLVTTRSTYVARAISGSLHCLYGLNLVTSVSLFKSVAFGSEAQVDESLMEIGVDIVRQCNGIPLAIKTLGRLLFSKRETHEWLSVRNSKEWQMGKGSGGILTTLKISYDQLTPDLKRCFLYCSVFPEGYVFRDYSLISFWRAHGLIKQERFSFPHEEVGQTYIDEFISRGFFQDFLQVGPWRSTFKMNDFVTQLARSLSQDEFQIVDADQGHLSWNVRHVWSEEQLCIPSYDRNIRSVIVPRERLGSSKALSEKFLPEFRKLRFLLLAYSELETLSDCVGTLKHLRSLDLEGCSKLKRLPNSICKLHNLDSLSLKGCVELEELPKNIGKLFNLRWLCVTTRQKYLPKNGIQNLNSLRFLWFSCCPNLESLFVRDQMEFVPLQTLVVEECNSLKSLFQLSGSAGRNNSLTALNVLDLASCEKLNLNEELLPSLTSLGIRALLQLEVLPDWIKGCANIIRYLEIKECHNLLALPDWLPSLRDLRTLKINDCSRLSSLPEDMNHLRCLEDLEIISCGQLSERCRGGGEEWSKISHIPNITVD